MLCCHCPSLSSVSFHAGEVFPSLGTSKSQIIGTLDRTFLLSSNYANKNVRGTLKGNLFVRIRQACTNTNKQARFSGTAQSFGSDSCDVASMMCTFSRQFISSLIA